MQSDAAFTFKASSRGGEDHPLYKSSGSFSIEKKPNWLWIGHYEEYFEDMTA